MHALWAAPSARETLSRRQAGKDSDYGSMKIAAETVLYAKPIGSYRNWNPMPGSLAQAWVTAPTRHSGVPAPLSEVILLRPENPDLALLWTLITFRERSVRDCSHPRPMAIPGAGTKIVTIHLEPAKGVDNKPQRPCFTLTPQPKTH